MAVRAACPTRTDTGRTMMGWRRGQAHAAAGDATRREATRAHPARRSMRCALPACAYPSARPRSRDPSTTQPHTHAQPHARTERPIIIHPSIVHPPCGGGGGGGGADARQVHASPVHRDHHPTWDPPAPPCTGAPYRRVPPGTYYSTRPGALSVSLPLLMTGGPGAGASGQGGSLGAGSAWAGDR